MESPMPPESNEQSAADTPPPSQAPTNAPGGAGDPWPRNDAPLPRWSEPPAAPGEPPPVGGLKSFGVAVGAFVGTLVALWLVASVPGVVLNLLLGGASLDGPTGLAVLGLSILLAIATAVAIARWCNQPARRHIRQALNIGFGCAVGLVSLATVLFGICMALVINMY